MSIGAKWSNNSLLYEEGIPGKNIEEVKHGQNDGQTKCSIKTSSLFERQYKVYNKQA